MIDNVLEALNRAADELSPADIDTIIKHYRHARANYEGGVKPKAEAIDLVKALNIKPKQERDRRF
jgi:hypothetical protein